MASFISLLKKYISVFLIYFFNRCFPIKNNKIFMFSYYGSQYGCNPKYITEHIKNSGIKDEFDIVWAFNNPDNFNISGIRTVKTMSLRYFYEMCTSKIVITNFRTTDHFVKRKNQYYIQTWHSSLRLKQIEKDAENSLPKHYVELAKKDSMKCDLLLSGCEMSTEIFKRAFWYSGEIFEFGTPRNDVLFNNNEEVNKKVRNELNIPEDVKVVLYAPTFRKNNDLSVYNLNYNQLVNSLEKKFGSRWICLVKLHPHLLNQSSNLVLNNKVIDVTKYDDIQELLSISNVLITDYSSLMFDFVCTKKPVFLYVPDISDYTQKDRKLYFDIKELPFKAATNNLELNLNINYFNINQYKLEVENFLSTVGSYENGKASALLFRQIYKICFGKEWGNINETIQSGIYNRSI